MKTRFSFEEHKEVAEALNSARELLIKTTVKTSGAYPHRIAANKLNKALTLVDTVRSNLDDELFNEYHPQPKDMRAKIYYPGGTK